ncbi:MAG: YitT family protein [Lutibacter sp.]|uniref:YitT family protein n=1 Tax=Lutibacter sp. TaxID=1925666 RepID=UPI00299EB62D|nr:YitT family protein [Lutibacter sp.]MDX1827937.1 YitT family protein [Lutibacter sp.]
MQTLKKEFINYSFIIIGSFITSVGVVGFLIPNKIVTGGTAGLSIVFHYLFNLPTGVLMFLINFPLLLISIKYLGKKFAIRTVVTIILLSVFIDLLAELIHFPILSTNTLLATIYGGIGVGVGLGLIFKGDSSAGGSTIIAKLVTSKTGFKSGSVILFLDIIVVISAGIVFKNIELALWSMISIFVASKFIDLVLTGIKQNKIVHISSTNLEDLKHTITTEMGITGTLIKGDDLHFDHSRNIIFLSINKNRIIALKNLVEEHDKNAYMIVLEATELLGTSRKL